MNVNYRQHAPWVGSKKKAIWVPKSLVFKGFRYENLYLVDFNASGAQLSTCLFTKSSMGWLWHRRLGHIGMKQLKDWLSMTWLEA